MQILSHRGYWKNPAEKNSVTAFEESFRLGFGTETDLRDLAGALVVSHDPPASDAMAADTLFSIHQAHDSGLTLALNVKADGLQTLVSDYLGRFGVRDAFVFDMSIPDTLHWIRAGVPVFTRHSDVEPDPVLYTESAGVWLDGFHSDWWDAATIMRHLDAGKRVCIVSPDLHRREHLPVWDRLKSSGLPESDDIMLCTDYPEAARDAFQP